MILGIDIGGTNVAYGLVDGTGRIVYQYSVKTKNFHDPSHLLLHIQNDLVQRNLIEHVASIGIGAPSMHPTTGILLQSANLSWRPNINIKHLATELFEVPVYTDNDANAATYGEWIYGVGRGSSNILVLTLGTGVGSGIVADGKMVYGMNALAGELGHVIVKEDGRPCGCGRKGCLETYVASNGIVKTYQELYKNQIHIVPYDIFIRAKNGDGKAKKTFDFTGDILGKAIANFVAFSNPEKVILMGGILSAQQYLLPVIRKAFDDNVLYLYRNTTIEVSKFNRNEAPILGAAAITQKRT